MKRLTFILAFAFTLCSYSSVYAASVEITPTQLYLTNDNPTTVLTLKNLSEQPLLLQLHAVNWQQTIEGSDDYQKTNDLIINPPIVTIQPRSLQIIRLGLRSKLTDMAQEKSYRIFIAEVLPKVKREQGVNTLLQLSLPVFVEPATKQGALAWHINRVNKNELSVHLVNNTNTHIQIFKISLYQSSLLTSRKMFSYLLPMQSRTWAFELHSITDEKPVKLVANTDRGDITYYAPVAIP